MPWARPTGEGLICRKLWLPGSRGTADGVRRPGSVEVAVSLKIAGWRVLASSVAVVLVVAFMGLPVAAQPDGDGAGTDVSVPVAEEIEPGEPPPSPEPGLEDGLAACRQWLALAEQAATDRLTSGASGERAAVRERELLDAAADFATSDTVVEAGAAMMAGTASELASCRKVLRAQVAAAEATRPGEAAAALADTGSISGSVSGEGAGALSGIYVTACPYQGAGGCGGAVTDAAGTYTIAGLAGAAYRVWFHDPSGTYARGYYSTAGFRSDWSSASPVVVPPDAVDIDVTLPLGYRISGTVTKSGGEGLPDISAIACPTTAGSCGSAQTLLDGTYTISGLVAGSYRVWFVDPDGIYAMSLHSSSGATPAPSAATLIAVPPDATQIDVTLPLGHRIEGGVSGPTGEPLSAIQVYARPNEAWMSQGTSTMSDGSYRIGGLWPGAYRLEISDPSGDHVRGYYSTVGVTPSFNAATLIDVPPDKTVDVTLPLASHIGGTVTGASVGGLGGIYVYAYPADTGVSRSATTMSDGTYSIGGLWPGSYRVWFNDPTSSYLSGYYSTSGLVVEQSLATVIDIPPSAADIDVVLPPGNRISGVVSGPAHAGLVGINVSACSDEPAGYTCRSVTTSAGGAYQIGGLWPGSYQIRFWDPLGAYAGGYYGGSVLVSYQGEATLIEVPPDAAAVDVELPVAGHIQGTVTGPTGAILSGIYVHACPDVMAECGWSTTVVDGTYSIGGLWPAAYRVEFYDPANTYQRGYYSSTGFTPDYDAATLVEVPPDAMGIDVALPLGFRISGSVTGPSGEVLRDVSVSACSDDPESYFGCGGTRTGVDGTYVVKGLPAGSYRVEYRDWTDTYASGYYSAGGFTYDRASATLVEVPPDAPAIDVELPLGLRISGRVTGPSGVGVSARATACALGGDFCHYAFAGADGKYIVKGLNPGNHRLRFTEASGDYVGGYYSTTGIVTRASEATPITVPPDASGIDVALPAALHISGRVSNPSGAGIRSVYVTACTAAGSPCGRGRTDASGDYTVGGLIPGSYRLQFLDGYHTYASGYYSDDGFTIYPAQATPVTVPPDATGIDITLPIGSRIRGTVTGSGNSRLANVTVKACPAAGDGLCGESWTSTTGRYALSGLAPESYLVSFVDLTGVHASGYFSAAGFAPDPGDADPVVVPPDATGVNVQLPPGNEIGGTLTGPEDHPAVGVTATACSTTGDWCWSSVSDGAGDYLVTGLVPGTYQVSLTDSRDRYASGYYSESGFTANPAEATVLTVSPNQTGIDVQLPGARHIAGKVTGPGGVPLAGIHVTACPMSVGEFCGHATTAADGTYSASGLVRGMYEVAFDDPSGTYAGGFYDGSGIISSQSVRLKVSTEDLAGIDVQTWLAAHPPTQYVVTASNYRPKIGVPVTVSAQLADTRGLPVGIAGIEVTWTATGVGGELSATTSTTNAQGIATVTFTIRKAPGTPHHVTATDADGRAGTSPVIGRGQKP